MGLFLCVRSAVAEREGLPDKGAVRRKAKLQWLIPQEFGPLLFLDHIEAEGMRLFDEVCKHDMEGIVAKWKDGLHVPDSRKSTWIKIKNPEYSQLRAGMSCSKRASRGKELHPRSLRSLHKILYIAVDRPIVPRRCGVVWIRCIIRPELKRKRCRQPKDPYQNPR